MIELLMEFTFNQQNFTFLNKSIEHTEWVNMHLRVSTAIYLMYYIHFKTIKLLDLKIIYTYLNFWATPSVVDIIKYNIMEKCSV